MFKPSEEYLQLVRNTFQKYYNNPLTDEQVETLVERLLAFSKVVMDFYLKKQVLYGDKYETWLKEEIISRSNPDDISIMSISTGSNKTKKKKSIVISTLGSDM